MNNILTVEMLTALHQAELLSNAEIVYRYNRVESTKERRWSNMERIACFNVLKKVPTPQRASP